MAFEPTPEQEAILKHDPGVPARLLAGPGTGKSATIVAWIGNLVDAESPPRLRLLTFTRAATAELASKVLDHEALAVERPSTIHSFAISVLLQNPGTGDFPQPLRLADDWEEDQIIHRTLARRAGIHKTRLRRLFTEMASAWESLTPEEDPKVDPKERGRFLGSWAEHRSVFGYTLLSELPYALLMALRDHPDLEGADYDLLIVDEYQDLNACDLDVFKRIAERGATIIGAGDDDQSIYSFRKADPAGIRRFLDDYPGAGNYPLSLSRRCGRRILDWASYVIEGDPDRPDKPRLDCPDETAEGEVALLAFPSEKTEPRGIASLVRNLIDHEGLEPREILILLRADHNGHFSRPIKEELEKVEVPCSDPDALKRLLAEPVNRSVLEVMRLVDTDQDSIAWASLLTLTHGISDSFIDLVYEAARDAGETFGAGLLRLRDEGFPDVPKPSATKADGLIGAILAWLEEHPQPEEPPSDGWGRWIVESVEDETVPVPSDDLIELLLDLDELAESDQTLGRYLGQITPLGKDLAASKSEGVRIMSMMSSKGLTVKATIVGAVERDTIPRPDCPRDEERRLLYVAMTRSTDHLYLTWARQRSGPTARSGRRSEQQKNRPLKRHPSSLLEGGPVGSEDGQKYINRRWN